SLRNARFVLLILVFGLAACASAPPTPTPTILQVTTDAQPNVNPDTRARPSPVVLRFYELKSLAAFSSADFFSIFEREKETLGAELVVLEEFQLMPGTKRQFERKPQTDTRYIGVVAAFRDLERAQWRASMTVVPQQTTPVAIRVDGIKVSLQSP